MEGTILSGSLCDFLRYIKKKKGTSNWLRQIPSKPLKIMVHEGFEGCEGGGQ